MIYKNLGAALACLCLLAHPILAEEPSKDELELGGLIVKAMIEVNGEQAKYRHEFAAEADRQRVGWRFEVRRWGEFMELSVYRGGNTAHQSYSHALNLGKITGLRLINGHPPDDHGRIALECRHRSDDNAPVWAIQGRFGCKKETGHAFYLNPDYPRIDLVERPFVYEEPPAPISFDNYYPWKVAETVDFPRAAEDDRLIFDGTGVTLYVPYGLGKDVYQKVMAASGRKK